MRDQQEDQEDDDEGRKANDRTPGTPKILENPIDPALAFMASGRFTGDFRQPAGVSVGRGRAEQGSADARHQSGHGESDPGRSGLGEDQRRYLSRREELIASLEQVYGALDSGDPVAAEPSGRPGVAAPADAFGAS